MLFCFENAVDWREGADVTKQEALNDKKLRYYIARSIWLMMKLGIFIVSPHIGLPLPWPFTVTIL